MRQLIVGRTPHGVRELKHLSSEQHQVHDRRTPHGVRELKQIDNTTMYLYSGVAPHTGCVN